MTLTKTEIQQSLTEARELPLLVENLKECIEHCKKWKSINARFTQYITEKHPNYHAVLTKDAYKTNLFVRDKEGEAKIDITIYTSFDQPATWEHFIDYISKLKLFENIQHYEEMLHNFDLDILKIEELIESLEAAQEDNCISFHEAIRALKNTIATATRDQN